MPSERSRPPRLPALFSGRLARMRTRAQEARARVAPLVQGARARLRALDARKLKELKPKRPAKQVARDLVREAPRALRRAPAAIARGWTRSRQATERYRLLTDVLGALVIVGVILAVLALVTGGAWPPVLVVESGSMMHSVGDTDYGRFGTIDPGDIVLVRPIRGHVETWAENGKERYGRPGDVIIYAPNGNRANISVVHRAMAYVEVVRTDDNQLNYRLHWIDGQIVDFGREGIYFPQLGFDEDTGFTPANGYKPSYSGYITKGDNALFNPIPDQAGGVSALVDPSWIIGRASGELPWIGLGKLALQSRTNPAVGGWPRVGNAFAPLELWTCFWATLSAVILVPLTIDSWRWHRRLQREREREEALLEANRKIRAELAKRREAERAAAVALPAPILAPYAPSVPPKPVAKRRATFAPVARGREAERGPAPGPAPGTTKRRATFVPIEREKPRDR